MSESTLVEYLEIQGSAEMVTKSDLIKDVRDRGLRISDRNLAYYTSAGLIPPAVRVGSRGGAYPRIVIEQLAWVIRSRNAQVSFDAIRELLPLWRLLMKGRVERAIDLSEIEYVARRKDLSLEANYKIPFLFSEVFNCLCADCLANIEWTLKDGTLFHHSDEQPLTLHFLLGQLNDETGKGEVIAWTQLSFPWVGSPAVDSPTTITLGLPPGVPVEMPGTTPRCRPSAPDIRRRQREVLPLG